jgi:plasmid maintenance system antidote protein VapI
VIEMATEKSGEMYTAAKLAEALGVSQGKVKKLIEAQSIEPDEVKRGCKYYSPLTLEKLKAALEKE